MLGSEALCISHVQLNRACLLNTIGFTPPMESRAPDV